MTTAADFDAIDFIDAFGREWTQTSRYRKLRAANDTLRALLREWLRTPFFESREGWEAWLDNYKPRVIAALEEA